MKPEEIHASSQAKLKQITDLMALLKMTVEPRERINEQGFIEKTIYWIDHEKYEQHPPEPVKSVPSEEIPEADSEAK